MTFCFIYFSFIFGISCKDLTTQQSYSSSTTSTRASTIAPSWTTQSSSTQYSVPIPITRTFPSSSTTTSLQHSNICAIKFYTENNHDGETLEIDSPNGVSNLHMNEQSAQTFGTCCWKIYRGNGYRGIGKIIRGNSDFPNSEQWGWSSGSINSVKRCPRCNNCRI